jgi:hypothetical protein
MSSSTIRCWGVMGPREACRSTRSDPAATPDPDTAIGTDPFAGGRLYREATGVDQRVRYGYATLQVHF